jgi:hypothetical protein
MNSPRLLWESSPSNSPVWSRLRRPRIPGLRPTAFLPYGANLLPSRAARPLVTLGTLRIIITLPTAVSRCLPITGSPQTARIPDTPCNAHTVTCPTAVKATRRRAAVPFLVKPASRRVSFTRGRTGMNPTCTLWTVKSSCHVTVDTSNSNHSNHSHHDGPPLAVFLITSWRPSAWLRTWKEILSYSTEFLLRTSTWRKRPFGTICRRRDKPWDLNILVVGRRLPFPSLGNRIKPPIPLFLLRVRKGKT